MNPVTAPIALDDLDLDLDMVVTRAVTAHMNALAPELSPLSWTLKHSRLVSSPGVAMLSGLARDESAAQLARWAHLLGLESGDTQWSHNIYGRGAPLQRSGTVTYSGSAMIHGALTVMRVWGVLDRETYAASGPGPV